MLVNITKKWDNDQIGTFIGSTVEFTEYLKILI